MAIHKPVLLKEVLELLNPTEGQIFVDCTLGGGGHTKEIAKRVGKKGKVIALDFDKRNTEIKKQLENFPGVIVIFENFKNIRKVLADLKIKTVDGILADLGFSSDQLKNIPGLSFQRNEPLDMRMDSKGEVTAKEIINKYSREEIRRILEDFGEEKRADFIAREIVKARKKKEIKSTFQLLKIIENCWQKKERVSGINVATKTFKVPLFSP